ncbi:hypothetical protein FDP41_011499 [Naegleria fowleri]|uniref:cyclin-dependent kinase n=1 Tax=Naegleria fowleri TaxID=5763 RepID=A0A6A5CBD1_NAEFO|nr:uncharacterized protein FDP41_011499 [Naegleria fowleri]KAF0982569.1 hypothetical protein FDP41_011499 [Naegleria fowleri]
MSLNTSTNHVNYLMENYTIIEKIGEGTFGVVLKAKRKADGKVVALKKIRIRKQEYEDFPKNVIREAKSLQHVNHNNVLRLYEVFVNGSSLVLSLEYMKTDLAKIIKSQKTPFQESHIKCIMLMLLKGLNNCHTNNIMHRDIKPANLLFNSYGELKLGDFGLATLYLGNDQSYSHQVATRWYRAPELLYGSRSYNYKVDIWAAGCVMAELYNLSPLFTGENDIDQLYKVLTLLGVPSETNWPGVSKLPDFGKITFSKVKVRDLRELVPNASEIAIDLMSHLLQFDISKRYSAQEALRHPYFFSVPLPSDHSELNII